MDDKTSDLIARNHDVLRRVVVDRANGAHGFIPKYAMCIGDDLAFERAGYMTNFSSSVYMLTDRGRELVARLRVSDADQECRSGAAIRDSR